ncbi:MAG: hypothetical protein V6Z82_04815 [Flavobacteriales bacterium]
MQHAETNSNEPRQTNRRIQSTRAKTHTRGSTKDKPNQWINQTAQRTDHARESIQSPGSTASQHKKEQTDKLMMQTKPPDPNQLNRHNGKATRPHPPCARINPADPTAPNTRTDQSSHRHSTQRNSPKSPA